MRSAVYGKRASTTVASRFIEQGYSGTHDQREDEG